MQRADGVWRIPASKIVDAPGTTAGASLIFSDCCTKMCNFCEVTRRY